MAVTVSPRRLANGYSQKQRIRFLNLLAIVGRIRSMAAQQLMPFVGSGTFVPLVFSAGEALYFH